MSFGIAVICYFFGGQAAEAVGKAPYGFTFKAGGALAGFLIAFTFLNYAYSKFGASLRFLEISVMPEKGKFKRVGNVFVGSCTIRNRSTNKQKEVVCSPIWAAGSLTVMLREIGEDEMVKITVKDSNGGHWESEYFSILHPTVALIDHTTHEP
jgi:hypothetical protein